MYVCEKKQGRSFARNKGASIAKGKFLAFIDADVYLDKFWAQSLLRFFLQDDLMGAAQGQIIPCQNGEQQLLNKYRYRCVDEETKGNFILTSFGHPEAGLSTVRIS